MTDQHTSLSLSPQKELAGLSRATKRNSPSPYSRYFFVGMAVTFIAVTALGFVPDYMLFYGNLAPGITFDLHWFAHVHGAIMTTWLLLFLTQTILVVRNNVKFHRKLGMASLTLGIIIWINLIIVNVRPRLAWLPPVEDGGWVIFYMGAMSVLMFALFYTWGMVSRKDLPTHKRLMLLAVLCVLQASVDRMRFLPWINNEFSVRFIYLDILLIPLFIYDLLIQKRIHRITWIGSVVIILSQVFLVNALGNQTLNRAAFSVLELFVDKPVEVKLTAAQTEPLLGKYSGQDWNISIFRNGDILNVKDVNGPVVELGATAENELFLRTVAWKLSFIKGADGKVNKVIVHEPNASWEMIRVKD